MARINWIKNWRKPKRLLGVDISATGVKLIELEKTEAGCQPTIQALAPLPTGAVGQREIKDPLAVTEAVRQALAERRFQTREAVIALPDSLVINKALQLAANLNEKQIMAQVIEQAQQHMAYPVEEIYFDFRVDNREVQLVATRREHVMARASLIMASGLNVVAVDVESYAIARWYAALLTTVLPVGPDQAIAIIDIGATTFVLTIVRHKTAIFTRHDFLSATHHAEVNEIILLARRGLQFFQAQTQQQPAGLIITGGGAAAPDLVTRLEEQFTMPIFAAHAVANLAPRMALSYGLALRILSV